MTKQKLVEIMNIWNADRSTTLPMLADRILATLEEERKAEEPLAVLADRKGLSISWIGKRSEGIWEMWFNNFPETDYMGHTYQECEYAARKYLESLPDKTEK